MKNNIQKIDYLHHQFLLGNKEVKEEFEALLKAGIKEKDATALKIADSLKKKRTSNKNNVSLFRKKYDFGNVERVVSPLYRTFNIYIIGFFLFMLAINEGFNVI